MYSPVDGYRCTATAVAAASRRWRSQCGVAAAAVPICFTQSRRERSQCRMAAAAGPSRRRSSNIVPLAESIHNVEWKQGRSSFALSRRERSQFRTAGRPSRRRSSNGVPLAESFHNVDPSRCRIAAKSVDNVH